MFNDSECLGTAQWLVISDPAFEYIICFYDIIFFEEGWVVYLPEDIYDNGKYANILAKIDVGDKVTVSSDICFCNTSLNEIDIRGMASDNIGFDKESMLKTVITIG